MVHVSDQIPKFVGIGLAGWRMPVSEPDHDAAHREGKAIHPTHIVQTPTVSLFSTLAVCRRIRRARHAQPGL